jgi:NADH-quinone oxidoreductase subunit J
VLFLFVVMMLDVDFAELRQGFLQYLPAGVIVGLIFLIELLLVVGTWVTGSGITNAVRAPIPPASQVTNTQAIGRVLYTTYVHYFEIAGVVLLVAMIGAIVLTLQHRKNVQRQSVASQNARSKKTAMEIRNVRPGQGI